MPTNGAPITGRLVGVDYGVKRIGLAVCDPGQRIASPAATLHGSGNPRADGKAVLAWAIEHEAVGLIVGLPLNMDGTDSDQTRLVRSFADELAAASLPVDLHDERLTTYQAGELLKEANVPRSRKRPLRDAVAAQVILQSYLDNRARAGDDRPS